MTDATDAKTPYETEPPDPTRLRVSVIAQLEPIGRYENPDGEPLAGTTLEQYAEDLTHYLGKNLSRFTDPRGGDVFLHVIVQYDGKSEGGEFRTGHYVKDEKEASDGPADHTDPTDPDA